MTALPAAGYLSDNARNEGEEKAAVEAQRDFISEMPGGGAEQDLILSGDAITPAAQAARIINVDTEGGAGTDNLSTIVQTNVPDGGLLILRSKANARTVVVKNAAGGTGQILTGDGADISLTSTKMSVMLQRKGADFVELFRFYGNNAAAAKAALSLGTAASVNTGTGTGDVPTIAQGDARYAKLAGLSTQAFSCATGTGSQAVNKTQADSTYAKLAGDNTQQFNAADPSSAQHVVTKAWGQANLGSPARFKTTPANDVAVTSTGSGTIAHGLVDSLGAPVKPSRVWFTLVCQVAQGNWSVGDEILCTTAPQQSNQGISLYSDTTNVGYIMGGGTSVFAVQSKTTGAVANVTNANWKVRIYAEV